MEVYYRGSTIQFETASTATGLATLNQINDIAVAHALNKTGWGSNVAFAGFQDGDSMIPATIKKPMYQPTTGYKGMVADYYGHNNTSSSFDLHFPMHQLGRQVFLYNYFSLSTRKAANSTDQSNMFGGWPAIAEKIDQYDGKTRVNQKVAEATYKPKMGYLKDPLKHISSGLPYPEMGSISGITTGGHLITPRVANLTRSKATSATSQSQGDEFMLGETQLNMTNSPLTGDGPVLLNIYTPIALG